VIGVDHSGAAPVPPLDRIGEAVLDARVDVQLADAAARELALDRGDERPHQTAPAMIRIDEDVVEAGPSRAPRRSGHGEADAFAAEKGRRDHGLAVRRLPPHLADRERALPPLGALQRQHPLAEQLPRRGTRRVQLDRAQRVTVTTRGSPARSLITRVVPPSE
jgi:hypothetical protein